MSISYSKKVSTSIFTKMRKNKERVLVCFVWIFRRITCLCCKSKLSHAVIKLFTSLPWLHRRIRCSCCYLFWYWCSHIMTNIFGVFFCRSIFRHTTPRFFLLWNKFSFVIILQWILLVLYSLAICYMLLSYSIFCIIRI